MIPLLLRVPSNFTQIILDTINLKDAQELQQHENQARRIIATL